MISELANKIFNQAIKDYHQFDNIDQPITNPHEKDSFSHLLYLKNWIDTAQWHMEDVVRNPAIDPVEGLSWKRRIDAQNQVRTDMVEFIDGYFLAEYKDVATLPNATINTESRLGP